MLHLQGYLGATSAVPTWGMSDRTAYKEFTLNLTNAAHAVCDYVDSTMGWHNG